MEQPDADTIKGSYLAWVAMMHRTAESAIENRAHAIAEARSWGISWTDLGEAMGISRQAAHKRFGPAVNSHLER